MTSRLDTEAATRAQVGAVAGAFDRLGLRRDRAERLRLSAGVLGLDDLESTYDLTKGQAGKLLAIVRQAPDLASLRESADDARRRVTRRGAPGGFLGLLGRALAALTTAPKEN